MGRWTGLVASKASIRFLIERILFGSDWPHAEGLAQPKEFFANVATFTPDEQELIMRGNARQLAFNSQSSAGWIDAEKSPRLRLHLFSFGPLVRARSGPSPVRLADTGDRRGGGRCCDRLQARDARTPSARR